MKPSKKAVVTIEPSGSRWEEARRALQAVREKFGDSQWTKPRGWVWHHAGELGKIQLVPAKLHSGLPHTGGFDKYAPAVPPPVPRRRAALPLPLHDSYSPISSKEIERFEELLEWRLPESYRDFLLRWNGGQPRVQSFQVEAAHDEMLDYFLGIAPGKEDSIPAYLANYEDRVPAGLLPIAYDVFGNLVCLDVAAEVAGQVLFWDHEREPEPGDPESYNLTRIAKTFDEFLQCFFED